MQDLNVTIIQSDLVWENKEENLANFERKIRKEEKLGELIILPEMFNTAFSMNPIKFAESPKGKTFLWMKKLSNRLHASIAGSYMVVENGNYYNRFVVMHPNGEYQYYHKRHLFRMGNENKYFSAGKEELIFNIKGWKIKALICYDLRFPVFSKNNYNDGQYDYDALIYVANWPKVRDKIWRTLLIARALENQVFVFAVNRIGEDGNGLDHAGNSCVISPKGEYIIKPKADIEYVNTAKVTLDELNDFRTKFTVGLDWDRYKVVQ